MTASSPMKNKSMRIIVPAIAAVLLAVCSAPETSEIAGSSAVYTEISQEEAAKMMEQTEGYVIVDVRTEAEYEESHIPAAICIPNETIRTSRPKSLPDTDQVILVYCRSGNRSKQAAQKLADMGYTHVYEFGGINTWPGETVAGTLPEGGRDMTPTASVVVQIGEYQFPIELSDNSSAEAFWAKLNEGALTIELEEYGGFEKGGTLPWTLERNDEQITAGYGDLILYQGNTLTIYYDTNTWSLTKLGKVYETEPGRLKEALGEGDVTVTFYLEWTE